MPSLLEENLAPPARHRPLVPQRHCEQCHARRDVVDLTHVRGCWLCLVCFRSAATADASDGLPSLQQIDRTLRIAASVGRFAVCLLVLAISRSQHWFADAMTGVLLAAVVTWAIAAVWDVRFHSRPVLAESLCYAAFLVVWFQQGGTFFSTDMEQRALTMLGFLGMFSVKISHFVWRLTHGR